MFIATINEYKGKNAKADRSGNMPLILNVLGGKCPNKRLFSQGWADVQGMEVGRTYLINSIETDPHPDFGRQFRFDNVQEVTALDIAEFCEKYEPVIYQADKVKTEVNENAFENAAN